jgi:hypothetical protein
VPHELLGAVAAPGCERPPLKRSWALRRRGAFTSRSWMPLLEPSNNLLNPGRKNQNAGGGCDLEGAGHVWMDMMRLRLSGGGWYERHRGAVPGPLVTRPRLPLPADRRSSPGRGSGSGHLPSGDASLPGMARWPTRGMAAHNRRQHPDRSLPKASREPAFDCRSSSSAVIGPRRDRCQRSGGAKSTASAAISNAHFHTHLWIQPR